MKNLILLLILFATTFAFSQSEYEASENNPYGIKNPKAPEQLDDFKPLIGMCDCDSESRNPDGTWAKAVKMTWKYKYIMNGMAIQDETLKADGKHSGSIRQFSKDSLKWYEDALDVNPELQSAIEMSGKIRKSLRLPARSNSSRLPASKKAKVSL